MKRSDSNLVTVVLPFVTPFDIALFDLSLFSVLSQSHTEVELIIQMAEGSNKKEDLIRTLELQSLSPDISDNLFIQEIQTYGLNSWREAWKKSKGDFICFLEPQSTIYKNALEILVAQITTSKADFTITGHQRTFYQTDNKGTVHFRRKHRPELGAFPELGIFLENKLSLSSCLLDRRKISDDIFTEMDFDGASDTYRLLIKLISDFGGAFGEIATPTSEQYFSDETQLISFERLPFELGEKAKTSVSVSKLQQILKERQILSQQNALFFVRLGHLFHGWLESNPRFNRLLYHLRRGFRKAYYQLTKYPLFDRIA